MRWLLVCECRAVHRPKDRKIIKHEGGKPEVCDVEPSRFEIDCACGRKRLLVMKAGHWHQEFFEFHPPEPKPPTEPPPPPEDTEPLQVVMLTCGKCGDRVELEARSEVRHVCERCGNDIHLAKHRIYHCHGCGDDFDWWHRSERAWCMSCQGRSDVTDTGQVIWEKPPSTDGATNIAGDFKDQLYGRDGKDGLWQAYEKSERPVKTNIAEEVCEMADELLRFLVELAGKHQDYDAVRWLSHYSRLGERRVPSDDWESIEDKLKSKDRPRAAREWDDVQGFLDRKKPHVSKSPFATVVRRLAEGADWWRIGWSMVEGAKLAEDRAAKNLYPRMIFKDGVPGQIRERKRKWFHFLEGWGIRRKNAPEQIKEGDEFSDTWLAVPYPATYDETGSNDALVNEVIAPIFRWWHDNDAEDYAKYKYPKKGALQGRIRAVLRSPVTRQRAKSSGPEKSVQDGGPS